MYELFTNQSENCSDKYEIYTINYHISSRKHETIYISSVLNNFTEGSPGRKRHTNSCDTVWPFDLDIILKQMSTN